MESVIDSTGSNAGDGPDCYGEPERKAFNIICSPELWVVTERMRFKEVKIRPAAHPEPFEVVKH